MATFATLVQKQFTTKMISSAVVFLVILSFFLGLGVVWTNTQRTKIGYEFKNLQQKSEKTLVVSTKLEIERDQLLSPYALEVKAKKMGMRNALPGQIRQIKE